ncbi:MULTISPECIES: hypothetical protein [Streptomyces]|uniref:Uncharacterized protein n=1 Tax=Streptomyces achromogenes TaxID=67255 RepID=A0ABU0Q532_STRAH|nr:hypothetical protein [Streptomyces achromogenes]MDQ0685752.1 hypothetical protein [Streptomyces achromogenes]MDQ0832899.1 hypothetical protein [Streptomyces achromogenes]
MSGKNGGFGGKNRGPRVRAGKGTAGGRDAVYNRGDNAHFNFASPARDILFGVTLLVVIAGGLTMLWLSGNSDADHRDDAAPVSPTTARAEPRRTPSAGPSTGPPSLAPVRPSRTSAPPSPTPAPAALSGEDESAPLPDCRAVGEGGVALTPSELQVRDTGELSARVNCETKAGEHLYYMVRIDNIMNPGMQAKTGFYLKGELFAKNVPEQIDVDLRHAETGSIRYGFVQLLRDDEYARLKKESEANEGVIAALPRSSVTVSGEARVTRSS